MKKELLLFLLVVALKAIVLGALLWSANYSLGELVKFGDVQSYLKIASSYPLPFSLESMQQNWR